jgi:hypothetical protein
VPTPPATATHVPIPHLAVVEGLVDTLSRCQIGVVGEEYAVSRDGMEMFGVIDLEGFDGCRFAIGIRNANNKRFRLSCTVGLRVFVCLTRVPGGLYYSPVLAKHSKHFSLEDSLSIGVDRMQRNFEPMRRQGNLAGSTAIRSGSEIDDLSRLS